MDLSGKPVLRREVEAADWASLEGVAPEPPESRRGRGTDRDSERPIFEQKRVDIYLAPDGRSGNEAHFIDRTVTEPNGEFTVFAQVPAELELQGYEVFASTPGDSRFAPALSE